MGATIVWVGGIAATICGLGALASVLVPALAGLRALLIEAAVLGFCAVVIGTSFTWLGDHLWVIGAVCGLCLCGLAYWYWPRLRRFLAKRQARKALKD